MIKHALCAAALIAPFSPAFAEAPESSPVTARLVDGWQQPDGTRISAIQLTLAPGWKTYWRAPGDAGIPPEFNWRGSRNMGGVAVSWPTPEVFDQNGMRSVGYSHQVTLPLAVSPKQAGQPVEVNLTLDIGVCKDVCVPETLAIKGVLDAIGSTPQPAIAAALAEMPYTATESGAKGVTCDLSPSQDGLKITAKLSLPPTGTTEHVVIEAGSPGIWVSEATASRSGNTLTAEALMVQQNGAMAIDRSTMRFTVLGSSHAVDLRGCTPG